MPVLDMPLSELRNYRGTNPKPADFDQYWDRALAELADQKDELELIPAAFKAPGVDCFDLYFTGIGGARIHAQLLRPQLLRPEQSTGSQPALLMFHGYTGDAGEWSEKLGYAASGFVVAALDCRGQGGSSQDSGGVRGNTQRGHIIRGLDDAPEKLLFRQIFLDTAQLARIVMNMDQVDETRVGAMGGSQGGALTLACAALEPRVRKAVSLFPFLCDYQRVWQMDLAERAYAELKEYFRHFDPTHAREQEIFTRLGYIDIQHLAHRIRADVLLASGLMDDICPPSTHFAAYNRIMSAKEIVIYPDFGHENLPGFPDRAFTFLSTLATGA